jgi:RalA-binding protein 1
VDAQERIKELSSLIANLPLANYSLLRALTAHLILIVQNSGINKMTMRNVGIVFSPTLGIPAGVFSLMLGEFNRVFNVDDKGAADYDDPEERRNSQHYTDAAADQLLGLAGRSLQGSSDHRERYDPAKLSVAPSDDQSDDGGDEISLHEESETETTDDLGLSLSRSHSGTAQSRLSTIAAKRGLNLNPASGPRTGAGLPASPRPSHSPRPPLSPIRSPMYTPPQRTPG